MNWRIVIPRCSCSTLANSKTQLKPVLSFKPSVEWIHFWQILITVIDLKCIRRPICFVTVPCISAFYLPTIFFVRHWLSTFKQQTVLCCCLILVTISIRSKSRDYSFWWHSSHDVNTPWREIFSCQWRRTQTTHKHASWWLVPLHIYAYPCLYWRYSQMRIPLNMGFKVRPFHMWVWRILCQFL